MVRFYADENFLTTHEAGKSNQGIPDHEVLAEATAQNRAVLSRRCTTFALRPPVAPRTS